MKFDIDQLARALAARTLPSASQQNAAAVAAVLRRTEGGTEALLIRRTAHEHDPWSGHMAFPGGRMHPSDTSLLVTAVRETHEEVGIDLQAHAQLMGPLDTVDAVAAGRPAGFTITPFVFLLQEVFALQLDPNEVEEAVWAPLDPLSRGENTTTHSYQHGNLRHELPAFDLDGRIVWGLTHRMLQTLLQVAAMNGGPPLGPRVP